MLTSLKTAAASLVVGLTALTAVPATAQDGIYLNFGGDRDAGAFVGDTDHVQYRDGQRWYPDRPGNWYGDRPNGRWCTPDRALNKAERMGIRRARIADVGRRSITVSGRSRGDRVFVTFARAPRCPVIG